MFGDPRRLLPIQSETLRISVLIVILIYDTSSRLTLTLYISLPRPRGTRRAAVRMVSGVRSARGEVFCFITGPPRSLIGRRKKGKTLRLD